MTDKFTAQEGFFVSAALTNYNSDTDITEDAKYGELVIEHFGWGNVEALGLDYEQVDTHFCSDEELGIRRTKETVIFPWHKTIGEEVKTYRKKFKCISPEHLQIWGDYNTA